MMKTWFAFLLTALICGAQTFAQLPPASPQPRVKLMIGTRPEQSACYIAQAKRFFEGLHVYVRAMEDPERRDMELAAGECDVYCTSADAFCKDRERLAAQGLQAFLIVDCSKGQDGLVGRPTIRTVSALRGKRVAYDTNLDAFFLFKVLQRAGLTLADIQSRHFSRTSVLSSTGSLAAGAMDGAVTQEPDLSRMQKRGYPVLATSREFEPPVCMDLLVGTKAFMSNPDVVGRFARGWVRAVEYIHTHSAEACALIASERSRSGPEIEHYLQHFVLADAALNKKYFLETQAVRALLAESGQFWKGQGKLQDATVGVQGLSTIAVEALHP